MPDSFIPSTILAVFDTKPYSVAYRLARVTKILIMGQPTSTMREIKGTAKTPWQALSETERMLRQFDDAFKNAKAKILKNLKICNRAEAHQRKCDKALKRKRRLINRTRVMLIVARMRRTNLSRIFPAVNPQSEHPSSSLIRSRLLLMMSEAETDIKILRNECTFLKTNFADYWARYKRTTEQLKALKLSESGKLKFLEDARKNLEHRRRVLLAMKKEWVDEDWTQLASFLDA